MTRNALAALLLCLAMAEQASAGDPTADQLIFTGATAPGQNTLTLSNNVYSFKFTGDETLIYQIDLNDPHVASDVPSRDLICESAQPGA